MRKTTLSLIACTLLAGVAFSDDSLTEHSTNAPEARPDATLDLKADSIAVGVGYLWGRGDLTYKGANHAFRISGVSIVDAGVARLRASGRVYNLSNLEDFNGSYTAVATGVTIAGGGSAAVLRNGHGVVIKLFASSSGLRFNFSAGKVSVKLTG